MQQVLICNNCHDDLTKPLTLKYGSIERPDCDDHVPPAASEEGIGVRHRTLVWDSETQVLVSKTVVWTNLLDVLENVRQFPQDIGCCGCTGRPNRSCKCGEIIGSEFSDCYDVHRFEPDESKTHWMQFIAHNRTRERRRVERTKADAISREIGNLFLD